ncbi:MAG: hypothetical protein IT366_16835 [Candidatus Hydrogenedentes bacterium]|nr:hypothetical protein [Candidatus Hydrogenedentota bacterium]
MSRFSGRRVSVFWGFFWWAPVIALPVGVFFFETWLQVRTVERGYAAAEVRRKLKDADAHINRLQGRIDELTALKNVSEHAPDMGLVPIQPGQVEVVYIPEASPAPFRADESIAIANADVPHGER